VRKIIKSPCPAVPEKAEIAVEGPDELYKEIRIENRLEDENGNDVKLKPGLWLLLIPPEDNFGRVSAKEMTALRKRVSIVQ
jgi:hypothetical protein